MAPFHSSSSLFHCALTESSTVKSTATLPAGCANPQTLATLPLLPVPQVSPLVQVPHESWPPQPSLMLPQVAFCAAQVV